MPEVSLLIATKNRLASLKHTLIKSAWLINNPSIEVIICDDGSIDGTYEYLISSELGIQVIRNEYSKGIHYCRNLLLNRAKGNYAVSLDDDTNFLFEFDIDDIINYFKHNTQCSVIAFKILWSKKNSLSYSSKNNIFPVKSFGAGACAINLIHWRLTPDLPDWIKFYGEEDIMSLNFLRIRKEVHFNDNFVVQHWVNLIERKRDKKDYYQRMRLSIRAGWFIYLFFFPLKHAFKSILFSVYSQIMRKVLKGDIAVLMVLLFCFMDTLRLAIKIMKYRNKLSLDALVQYENLKEAQLY